MMKACGAIFFALLFVIHQLPAQSNLIVPTALLRMAAPTVEAKAPSPPDLNWPNIQTSLGYIAVDSSREIAIDLTNTGGKALEISKVRCSCNQIEPASTHMTIAPGTTGKLRIRIRPEEVATFKCMLTLYTNTEEWIHIIPLKGIAYRRS